MKNFALYILGVGVIFLGGCIAQNVEDNGPDDDLPPGLVLVECEDTEEKFVYPTIDGPPQGAGEEILLAKVQGDDHCYQARPQFEFLTDPDVCPEKHFHGDKIAIGGHQNYDDRPDSCGIATQDEVEIFTAYRWQPESDDPRDDPPPIAYCEDLEECVCTPDNPCCGPDVTPQMHDVFERIVSTWNTWDADSRKNHCETVVDIEYVTDSWDIRELNEGNIPTWSPEGCNTGNCENSVNIVGGCWLDGVANYSMWGVIVALCEDVNIGPYDRFMIGGFAKFAWTEIASEILYDGDNNNLESQSLMMQAGYDATEVDADGQAIFKAWKYDAILRPQAAMSPLHSCKACDKPAPDVPSQFRYRWRDEG